MSLAHVIASAIGEYLKKGHAIMDATIKAVSDEMGLFAAKVRRIGDDIDAAAERLGTINSSNLDPEDKQALDSVLSALNAASTSLDTHAATLESKLQAGGAGGSSGPTPGGATDPSPAAPSSSTDGSSFSPATPGPGPAPVDPVPPAA